MLAEMSEAENEGYVLTLGRGMRKTREGKPILTVQSEEEEEEEEKEAEIFRLSVERECEYLRTERRMRKEFVLGSASPANLGLDSFPLPFVPSLLSLKISL